MIAIGAAAVVAIAWLAVSFIRPSAGRRRIEWLGATALYVALLAMFVNLVRRSIESDNEAGMIAFGFLTAMFSIGLVIASIRTIAALRGGSAAKDSGATH
jgi:predicted branched-subunit amino acid permease